MPCTNFMNPEDRNGGDSTADWFADWYLRRDSIVMKSFCFS